MSDTYDAATELRQAISDLADRIENVFDKHFGALADVLKLVQGIGNGAILPPVETAPAGSVGNATQAEGSGADDDGSGTGLSGSSGTDDVSRNGELPRSATPPTPQITESVTADQGTQVPSGGFDGVSGSGSAETPLP